MKMKLIVPMLVICLIFSLGSALAQTDTPGIMDKIRAGSMDKMARCMDQATVIMAGKMNGTVTMDKMTGMAGGMSSSGKTMTRNITGDLVIIKDISNKTENIIMIGKMDGMTKKIVMIGKTEYENGMPGNNEGMNGMGGKMDNMVGAKDNEKVVATGDIKCMTVGKMVIIGQESDFKEMAGENQGMTGMTGENQGMTGVSDQNQGVTGVSDEKQIMSGMNGNMDKAAGAMNNKNVIATANIRCNMTGKMIIIGKLSDIKKMAGYGKEKGAAAYKAGVAGDSKEDIKGVAYKAGAAGYSNEDMTIIMTGITKCKITGINMVVIGKMDKMTGMAEKIDKKPGMAGKMDKMTENMTEMGYTVQ
jgi:hypothetical protein